MVPRRGAPGEKDSNPWAKAHLDGSSSHLSGVLLGHTPFKIAASHPPCPGQVDRHAHSLCGRIEKATLCLRLHALPPWNAPSPAWMGDVTTVPATRRLTLPAPVSPASPASRSDFGKTHPCNAAWAFCTCPGIRSSNPSRQTYKNLESDITLPMSPAVEHDPPSKALSGAWGVPYDLTLRIVYNGHSITSAFERGFRDGCFPVQFLPPRHHGIRL